MQKKTKINKKAQKAGTRVQLQAVSHFYDAHYTRAAFLVPTDRAFVREIKPV